ncbi:hypothetical protein ACFWY9_14740 [Amycolatopsis sp. NPDC059027]|uniref:hypothetical protein n=1 Tax=unclassified Amycolatopsis TaxID=2618356 RepID=UPI00366DC0E7
MKLRKLTEGCNLDQCPAVYLSDSGTVVFQGDLVTDASGLRLGTGEQAVELPLGVVLQAIPELPKGV